MSKRAVLCTAILVLTGTLAGPAWSQRAPAPAKRSLPNFDARDFEAPAGTPERNRQVQSRALVERRKLNMESYAAAARTAAPGTRIVPNRHGAAKLLLRDGNALTGPSTLQPEEIARNFLRSHAAVFPFAPSEVDGLRLTVHDAPKDATFIAFNQTVNGIDVFNGQIKFTLSKAGEVVQVAAGDVAPGVSAPATPGLTPEEAVKAAYRAIRVQPPASLSRVPDATGGIAFANPAGGRYNAISAELSVFPLNALSARLAYRIILDHDDASCYEILVDANDGSLLYRHNRYVHQTGQANVWKQSPLQGSREMVTFPSGWLPAGATVTTGNNVDAFLDANGNDQPDTTTVTGMQGGRPYSSNQVFDFPFGDGVTGLDPRQYQAASVTNLFYLVNVAHDYYYNLGFNEAAGNYQADNYGRGGLGGDAVLAEGQNPNYVNNASFAPTSEGKPAHMRMGLFTEGTSSATDDTDTDYDAQVVLHEYGHGVTNRLVGAKTSTSCLDLIQSGAMGEGWSDYFSISYTNNPVEGAYPSQNTARGIRRHSYEGYPYTYENIGNTGYEVHDDGEIWAATLWDLRKSLGQAVTDQLVINGLKSTPCSPSMTDARDAILSADQATNSGANRQKIWQVFAQHGMGSSAIGIEGDFMAGTRYDAAYDLPADLQTLKNPSITSDPLTVSVGLGQSYPYTVAATNPNGGTLSYSLVAGPAGMAVDSAGGSVSWTAGFTAQRVQISVTDGKGGKVVHGYLLPVFTHLSSGAPVTISGAEYSAGYASVAIPTNVPVLQVTLRGGTGDSDLWVQDPDGNWDLSGRYASNETLSFPGPTAGDWIIEVDGYSDYSGVTLMASQVTPTPLAVNTTLTGLSAIRSSESLYRITVPANAKAFSVSTSGGTGDTDIYLKRGSPALCQSVNYPEGLSTGCYYDEFSAVDGNAEFIGLTYPAAADYYLDLSAYDDYAGVTLTTSFTSALPSITTTSKNLPSGFVGGAYSYTLSATGGTSPYTWAVTSGSLPPGLSPSGATISGKPTTIGTFSFTIQLKDSGQIQMTAAQDFSITIVAGPSAGAMARAGILPQIAAGGGWDTAVWLVNNSASPVPVEIVLHGDDGGTLSLPLTVSQGGTTQTLTTGILDAVINPNAPLIIASGAGLADNLEGWADVLSGGSINGFAVFRFVANGVASEGTTPLQAQGGATLLLPFDNTGDSLTGLAIANLASSKADITATVWDDSGKPLGTQSITFTKTDAGGNGHDAFMLPDRLPATKGIRGTVQFQTNVSSGKLGAVGLRARTVPSFVFTSVPTM